MLEILNSSSLFNLSKLGSVDNSVRHKLTVSRFVKAFMSDGSFLRAFPLKSKYLRALSLENDVGKLLKSLSPIKRYSSFDKSPKSSGKDLILLSLKYSSFKLIK